MKLQKLLISISAVFIIIIFTACQNETVFEHPLMEFEDQPGDLKWVDIEGMKCRDGSETGIGVVLQDPKKLVIYINGGGACFNEFTCPSNPSSFTEEDLNAINANGDPPGIFSRMDERNPVKDWSFVYIPYCTGDVHSGTLTNGQALGVPGQQKYIGAINFKRVMRFIAPYFREQGVEEVLLFGLSAGGFGVYINFLEVFNEFPDAQINVINDSGPLFSDPQAFPPCLQLGFTLIFGLPIPPDMLECCEPNIGLANVYQYSSERYPDANFGFLSSLEDQTSRFFLSFGMNDCSGIESNQIPADIFSQALIDLRDDVLIPRSDWSSWYINGGSHTLLASDDKYYEQQVGGMFLYEFVNRLLNGDVMHISE